MAILLLVHLIYKLVLSVCIQLLKRGELSHFYNIVKICEDWDLIL